MGVAESFRAFCGGIRVDMETRSLISLRYRNITQRLNKDFWNKDSNVENSIYVGSYGRRTAINGLSDLDMIFQLPYELFLRYDKYQYNGQSTLLWEIRNSIKKTYANTDISGDGQVVIVRFSDNIIFEVVPVFRNNDDSFKFPNSNGGGYWKKTNPLPEIDAISSMNLKCNYNLKRLCKMARTWKKEWKVPMGGLLIDTLAYNFLKDWEHKDKSYYYYDWLSRDFFEYLSRQDENQQYWLAVGSNQQIERKGPFEAKAKKCYKLCLEAIEYESQEYQYTAKSKWREIFGTKFPN